ncbi:unnamed protein product [Cylindrotheca closterium]|uniref:Methyltransferase FkbM domain-containing protein n=1 Tax=Cylindrotheca closterium TaxID=2856 RepID=A0AAD2FFL9_9STRA|nr:unnamed protein product [Cylindrotheca closterium]
MLFPKPPLCTTDQLMKVRHHMPPETCVRQHVRKISFFQVCSLTAATKCPNATWLEDYYLDLQREHYNGHIDQSSQGKQLWSSSSSSSSLNNLQHESQQFLGISIGCNKGFDAINTLRMGTYDADIDKAKWKQAMTSDGSESLHLSVCNQDSAADVFPILNDDHHASNNSSKMILRPRGEMHCIEPMPQTYHKLQQSAETLGYTDKGLVVTHGAVSRNSGEMPFRSGGKAAGVENIGLGDCRGGSKQDCEMVKVYSLLEFVERKVQAPSSQNINVLSIDVEGFDGDVLLGATSKVLERVEYLEFEYNWMGSWKRQHLYDIIELLDEQASMVCYWAGRDRLWRITECWMSYYDVHSWSNVACANRRLVPELAAKMEETFQRTLEDETQWFKHPNIPKKLGFWQRKYKDHVLLSLEEDKLRQKYIRI